MTVIACTICRSIIRDRSAGCPVCMAELAATLAKADTAMAAISRNHTEAARIVRETLNELARRRTGSLTEADRHKVSDFLRSVQNTVEGADLAVRAEAAGLPLHAVMQLVVQEQARTFLAAEEETRPRRERR